MNITQPDYYSAFHCLAGACPDTCCADWEVLIDEASLARYDAVAGPLGQALRGAIVGRGTEPRFRLRDGKCALLTPEGLCPIQAQLGEAALCRVCGFFPRFETELGLIREQGVSLSCPEAARLILTKSAPLQLQQLRTGEPLRCCHELEPALILGVRAARDHAMALAQNRAEPIALRCIRLLEFGRLAQAALDREDYDALSDALAQAADEARTFLPAAPEEPEAVRSRFWAQLLAVLSGLEHLRPDWTALLAQAAAQLPGPEHSWQDGFPFAPAAWEQLLCYYIFKYFLRAAFDAQLEPVLHHAVLSALLLHGLCSMQSAPVDSAGLCALAQAYARETEHSEENLQALRRAFAARPALQARPLQALLALYLPEPV